MLLKLLCLITSLLLITSCDDIDEPEFSWCVMSNFEQMHCFDPKGKEYVRNIKTGLGYIMLSPEDVGKLKDHHRELHTELDFCE